jgi:hypothetical protein
MEKFTIVYSRPVGNNCCAVEIDRVEIKREDLRKLIDSDKYNGFTHFIFEGWPQLEGEY